MPKYIEYEPGEKFAGTDPATSDFHEAFQDCGIELEKSEVVIDIDHIPRASIEAMLDIFDIETQIVWTERGCHLHFKKPGNRTKAADGLCQLGFEVELLTASSRPNGVLIKRNGELREIENAGIREDLPAFLKPSKQVPKDLTGMQDGDGRNKAIFAHAGWLQRTKAEDQERILRFINKYVFDEPLEEREFQSATRVETKKDLKDISLPISIIEELNVVSWSGQLWYYDHNLKKYTNDLDQLKEIIYDRTEKGRSAEVEEALKIMVIKSPRYKEDYTFRIHLTNGYLENGHFEPEVRSEFSPYTISLPYDSNAEVDEGVEEYLNQIVTETDLPIDMSAADKLKRASDYRERLLEIMAFGLIVDPEKTRSLAMFHILRGDGANGKGTFLQILKTIYGKENCAYLSIEDLGAEAYLNQLVGKLLNLGDDIEDTPIKKKQFKIIKNITSADGISIRFLYENAKPAVLQAKLLFTSNSDIKTFDKGYALIRRICWVPMFNTVTKPDPNFISRMTSDHALRYWIKLIVEAYFRLYEFGWTESAVCAEYNKDYHMHNDISLMFISDFERDDFDGKSMAEVTEMFNAWNTDDDKKLPAKQFKQNLWNIHRMGFGKKKLDGGTSRKQIFKQENTKQNVKPKFK